MASLLYHEGNRRHQEQFASRRLADRLEQVILRPEFTDADRAFIESAEYFFRATADAEGRPDCSFKGGPAGFARVTAPGELAFPDYDGNGMFKSLGNIAVNPGVGLLFIAMGERPARLRENGTATVARDDPLLADFVGAQLVVDALVTKTAGQVIACLTADCGPVLVYAEDQNGAPVIGAAHAGWGGALKGVLESTMTAMVKLGADQKHIRAAIGPWIGQASYEVGLEFSAPFLAEDPASEIFFRQGDHDQLFFDLQGYLYFRLKRCGVDDIVTSNRDTYALKHEYFSYRRATHAGEKDYGRQISAIMIKA